jgi:DNA-binding PadR family transcriptional regulator
MRNIPELTHLQFLVLTVLLDGERSGRQVREKLAEAGENKSGPAFYQLMARLEDAKLVAGWYDQKVVEGQIIKERRYRIEAAGASAWDQQQKFYAELAKTGRVKAAGVAMA